MTMNTTSPLRFAIIGGGIAGAAVANALIGITNLDIHVFESASEFSERGAAVGLAINAQRALAQIVPSATELLDKAGAVDMNSTQRFLGSGPQAGAFICDTEAMPKQKVVHRASLLRELLRPLPQQILHTHKQLSRIIQKRDTIELSFKDGTTESFHAVIGADGMFSTVRGYVLQDATAHNYAAKPAGFWDCRNLVPIEKAKSVLGEGYFYQNRQHSWIGDGGFMMHDIVEGGKLVHCVISGVETSPPSDRKSRLSKERLTNLFNGWLDGPIAPGMIELLCEQPSLDCYSQWEHKSTPAYANGRCCIVGDAAHATSPWQGAGAGLAIEDAMVLGCLLSDISTPDDINAAFKAFDAVRRPRGQRVIDSSREAGRILCGRDEEAGLDPSRIRVKLANRLDFILGIDMEMHKKDALSKLREMQGN